jgi:hypothetical protein
VELKKLIDDKTPVATTQIVQDPQASLLSKLDGIGLPIPLSEKEIRLSNLKDEAIALVKSIGTREKELSAAEKKLDARTASFKHREKIPAMAEGWNLMSKVEPPKGKWVLYYCATFANQPYSVLSYVSTNHHKITWKVDIGADNIQSVHMHRDGKDKIYWTYLEDFDGDGKPSDISRSTVDTDRLCLGKIRKGLTTSDIFTMYGKPSSRKVNGGYGDEDRTWFYNRRIKGHLKLNYLRFENDKLVYWDLDYNF